MNYRVGQGYDVHAFETNRPCVIGGVTFDFALGLKGHSDADVLLHAIADALLGALALGDLGDHFPDTDVKYKNCSSRLLLGEVYQMILNKGYRVVNLDTTVVCEAPKIKLKRKDIQLSVADLLKVDPDCVSIKATTEEKMGFTGRGEGIKAYAVVLLEKVNA